MRRELLGLGFFRRYRVEYADLGKSERHRYGGPCTYCWLEVGGQHHNRRHQLQRVPRNLLGGCLWLLYEHRIYAELHNRVYRQRGSRWHDSTVDATTAVDRSGESGYSNVIQAMILLRKYCTRMLARLVSTDIDGEQFMLHPQISTHHGKNGGTADLTSSFPVR